MSSRTATMQLLVPTSSVSNTPNTTAAPKGRAPVAAAPTAPAPAKAEPKAKAKAPSRRDGSRRV